jgi:hypothetical protein
MSGEHAPSFEALFVESVDLALQGDGGRGALFDGSTRLPDTEVCKTIFSFVVCMGAVVAGRRGGKTSDHLRECADFMVEVVGKRLSVADPLPPEFDWTVGAAREAADAMMEYDHE